MLHSHAYTDTYADETEQLAFDTPARNDFARLISNHFEQSSPNDLLDSHMHFAADFSRPSTQPVLPSSEEARIDGLGFDATPMKSSMALPDIRVDQC